MNCILCKKSNLEIFFSLKEFPLFFGAVDKNFVDQVPKYNLDMAICIDCKHVQQTNLVDEDIMNSVYTAGYYNCPSPSNSDVGEREIKKFYNFFKKCNQPKGELLEIACFDGYFLEILNNDGWDIYGCDPAANTSIAISKFGEKKIKKEFLSSNTFNDKKFDAIIFRNLLEHIYDINSFINLVSSLLKKDGSIYIDLPNVSTTESYGGYGLFFHQHISYFSIDTMNNFLSSHNFTINNFYDGSPNLFIHASKHNEIKVVDKKSSFDYKNLIHNNKKIKNKINSFFDNESNISLFGASALATTILCNINQSQKDKVRKIFDNEKIKHFKILQGTNIEISDPNKITPDDTKYLITSYFFDDEICDQLISYGINRDNIIKINDLIL